MSRTTDHSSPKYLISHPSYPNLTLLDATQSLEIPLDGQLDEPTVDSDLLDFTLTSGPIELALIAKREPIEGPSSTGTLS